MILSENNTCTRIPYIGNFCVGKFWRKCYISYFLYLKGSQWRRKVRFIFQCLFLAISGRLRNQRILNHTKLNPYMAWLFFYPIKFLLVFQHRSSSCQYMIKPWASMSKTTAFVRTVSTYYLTKFCHNQPRCSVYKSDNTTWLC